MSQNGNLEDWIEKIINLQTFGQNIMKANLLTTLIQAPTTSFLQQQQKSYDHSEHWENIRSSKNITPSEK